MCVIEASKKENTKLKFSEKYQPLKIYCFDSCRLGEPLKKTVSNQHCFLLFNPLIFLFQSVGLQLQFVYVENIYGSQEDLIFLKNIYVSLIYGFQFDSTNI